MVQNRLDQLFRSEDVPLQCHGNRARVHRHCRLKREAFLKVCSAIEADSCWSAEQQRESIGRQPLPDGVQSREMCVLGRCCASDTADVFGCQTIQIGTTMCVSVKYLPFQEADGSPSYRSARNLLASLNS